MNNTDREKYGGLFKAIETLKCFRQVNHDDVKELISPNCNIAVGDLDVGLRQLFDWFTKQEKEEARVLRNSSEKQVEVE